jgi:ABC-type polar amino acid transport system ATPase subunit
VATVSPAAVNAAETLSTLRFADQAKRIKNQVGGGQGWRAASRVVVPGRRQPADREVNVRGAS